MRTKVIVNRSNNKLEYTINEINEGEYFLDEYGDLCVRTENIYDEDKSRVYSNSIRLDTGLAQIFTTQKLRLVKEIKIDYQL